MRGGVIFLWLIPRMLYGDNSGFFETMIGNDFSRLYKVIEGCSGSVGYYIGFLQKEPMLTCACLAAISFILPKKEKLTGVQFGMLCWAAIPFVVFSLCPSKLRWYIYPVFFAMAMCAGIYMGRLFRKIGKRSLYTFVLLAIMLLGAAQMKDTLSYVISDRAHAEPRNIAYRQLAETGIAGDVKLFVEDSKAREDRKTILQDQVMEAYLYGWNHVSDGGAEVFLKTEGPKVLLIENRYYGEYEAQLEGFKRLDLGDYSAVTDISA